MYTLQAIFIIYSEKYLEHKISLFTVACLLQERTAQVEMVSDMVFQPDTALELAALVTGGGYKIITVGQYGLQLIVYSF